MPMFLGIDTSNYTTSAAVFNGEDIISNCKKLLPVKDGACGLRQSDAVFHHTQQISDVVNKALNAADKGITAVGVSVRPRDVDGSYMPCFTVGKSCAEVLSNALNVPLYTFSHQAGHVSAALYSAGRLELLNKKFIAFHVSGGTTEALLVSPSIENIFDIQICAKTLDLNAGQLVDRVGVMLGLHFPCGAELEKLAIKFSGDVTAKATLKGADCCLSGIENICQRMLASGASHEETAYFCIKSVEKTLDKMCEQLLREYGRYPLVFAGGVMSNSIIKEHLKGKYSAFFAEPQFSSDNAAGIAVLSSVMYNKLY